MKLFWLSFVDPERPEGERFLGVSIVQVTEADRRDAYQVVLKKFGQVRPNADWFAAAIRKAWFLGINPGGQVGATELHDPPKNLPVDVALTPEQIQHFGQRPS